MRVLLDKNVPAGARAFMLGHEVFAVGEIGWPDRLKNGELLAMAERSGFEVLMTCDQNIRFQQNLAGRKLALIVLGSNVWAIVRKHGAAISAAANAATAGSYTFVEMPLPPKPPRPA